MTIRRLGPDDIFRVHEVWRSSGLTFAPQGRDAPEVFAQALAETSAFLLGYEVEDRIVAVVLGTDDGRKGWINRLAVVPEHRGSGVARALVEACEAEFTGRGILLVCALVEEPNADSLSLFESAGYQVHRDITYLRKPLADPDW